MVELAIFGTLILFAFNILLMYGQTFNDNQKMKMEAFRKALQRAYYKNSSVSYTVRKDKRNADLFSAFGFGQGTTTGASANVMWCKGSPGEPTATNQQAFAFYQINDKMIGDPDDGLNRETKTITTESGNDQEVTSPVSVWKEEIKKTTKFKSEAGKGEDPQRITNTREAGFSEDNIEVTLHTRFDDASYDYGEDYDDRGPPEYEKYEESESSYGAYVDSDGTIKYGEGKTDSARKQREWKTDK